MFPDEKDWIISQLKRYSSQNSGRALDVESEGMEYRQVQPHIGELYRYLSRSGLELETMDVNPNSGANHISDICDGGLDGAQYNLVTCTNTLEHVSDIYSAARNLETMVTISGLLLVTVPHNLPKHDHPIDNGFRPIPDELSNLFSGLEPIVVETFPVRHYKPEFIGKPNLPMPLVTGGLYCKK